MVSIRDFGARASVRFNRTILRKYTLTAVFFALFVMAGTATAATPTIVNQSSTGGQTNWLETFSISNDTGNGGNRVRVSLNVRHDPGRAVTGLRIDEDYNGTDNAASATIRAVTSQQPTVVNGYDHSRISYSYLASTSSNGLDCGNVFGGHVATSTKPLRIRARLDNGEETATSVTDLKWSTADCTGKDDYPRLFGWSQSATSVNVGTAVTFKFKGDDSDSLATTNQAFGGVNYRLRRMSDGVTTAVTKVCFGDEDNVEQSLPVTFSRRGRWVVEAQLLNINSTCGVNPNSGGWNWIGAVDVNSPASTSPDLTVATTRPQIGGNSTVTATFSDTDDAGQGGVVQDAEWDLDQNTGNGVAGFEVIDLGTTATGVSSPRSKTVSTTGMTPGLKTVRVRVTDNGALGGADSIRRTKTVSATFLVDTPPVASSASVSTETETDLPITLPASDVDEDTLSFTITDLPLHGTISGSGADRVYTPEAGYAGTDEFTFQVDDGYGGTDSATVSITVVPNIDPFAGPTGTVDSRATEVTFGSDADSTTFECSLDQAAWTACASPFTATDLADGGHEVRVRGLANGQTSAVKTASWTVDAYPQIDIVDGPDTESSMTSAAVEFALSEVGTTVSPTAECRLDSHTWNPCQSPVAYADLDDGPHRISIRATDAHGKQITEDVEWNITTAGSEAAIEAPVPATFTRENTAEINFTATGEAESFECSLDDGPWEACVSPAPLTGLTDGFHTFRVRSIDALGSPDELPAQISWNVDRTAPAVSITSGPNGAIPAKPSIFTFRSNESLSNYECSLDGANFAACNSPFHLAGDLADGPHNFRVAATDRAGNRSLAVSRNFRVLSVAPQVSLTGGPVQGAVTSSDAATFGFTTTPAASGFECRIDDAGWAPCDPPATMTGLTDGAHSFAVQSIDEVGNRSAEPAVRSWTVDTTPPETTITSGPSGKVKATDAVFEFSASEPASSFECSLDGATFGACATPVNFASLGDGQHDFRVRSTDAAGNRDQTPAARTWNIDTTEAPPTEPPPLPTEPAPCSFLIEQDRCGDPYVVASAKVPYRNLAGKAKIKLDIDSGGSALSQIRARFPIGLKSQALSGKGGLGIGRLLLTGETRTVVPLKLPAKKGATNVIGRTEDGLIATLKARTVIVDGLPTGTTGTRIQLKSTRSLRVVTSICGTRLWRTVLTDSSSNREYVDARADVKCVRKASR